MEASPALADGSVEGGGSARAESASPTPSVIARHARVCLCIAFLLLGARAPMAPPRSTKHHWMTLMVFGGGSESSTRTFGSAAVGSTEGSDAGAAVGAGAAGAA